MRITDDLLVRRAEHNDGDLESLEELALHQQRLTRIEYVNRVCANLRILQLQDNCIDRIENMGRLRALEYLNLAMNNVERIENLENLEALEKLDLTLNFVGDLTVSIPRLRENPNLRQLYLMGNPCTEFPGYRDFVVATLPQLRTLDGTPIDKSERILAVQKLSSLLEPIRAAEEAHRLRRAAEASEAEKAIDEKRKTYDDPSLDLDDRRQNFFRSESRHTPEFRRETQRFMEVLDDLEETRKKSIYPEDPLSNARPRRLRDSKGMPLNVNEAKVDFRYDDSSQNQLVVELFLWKHLDSSLIDDLVVEPDHLRLRIKGKLFQLRFLEEVQCDLAKAQRSQTTGHLVVTVPKQKPVLDPINRGSIKPIKDGNKGSAAAASLVDYRNIVKHEDDGPPPLENDSD